MTTAWPSVPLGELLVRIKEEVVIDDEKIYARLTIRMTGRGIVIRDTVPGFQIGTKHQFVARNGQLVLSKIDARNGAFGVLPPECDQAIITGNFWAFEADETKLDARYLNYLTQTPLFLDFCVRASEGTTNRRYLQEPQFLAQEIALPSLEEQARIVSRIKSIGAQISSARELRKQASDEADALLRSILLYDKAAPLVSMAELVRERAPDVDVDVSKNYRFAGVYSFGRGVFPGVTRQGMEFAYRRLSRLRVGDFIYPKLMAWEGALGVVPDSCDGLVVSPEFPVFEVNRDRVCPEVLDIYFRTPSVWPKLSGASTGTNVRRRRLNPAEFLKLRMPLPSSATQARLCEVKQKIDSAKRLHAETAKELEAMLPAVLERAFRGEL